MNRLDTKISKHAKDIIQKYTSGLFKNSSLEFYGIKTAKIKELINVELPTIEVAGSTSDFVFLLDDDTYLHLEFQSTYNKNDITRFAAYDLRLFERDGRKISTIVIYTADVSEAEASIEIGSLIYNPSKVMMNNYDGNIIYSELFNKIDDGTELTDSDMLNLIFLPLMKNEIPKDELAIKSIKLAQTIPDTTKRNACVAAAFAFANRYLNDDETEKILEVLKMTDLATMLVEGAIKDEKIEIARNALKEGAEIEFVKKITGLSYDIIQMLQSELS